jgi:mono/diheme cytochrome c family protein
LSKPNHGPRPRLQRKSVHALTALVIVLMSGGVACWEQWSEAWFPQMKWQKAIQAFERVQFQDQVDPFMPPEGAVAIGSEAPAVSQYDPASDALVNPMARDDFRSLGRGQEIYEIYCDTCHGSAGMGDGPVSMAGAQTGPFAGVFPLVTAMGRSDGYIYNLIRAGGARMPSYQRIPSEDRWHIVNYVRYLQNGGQP